MPISLHAATIPSWLQILGAATGWVDKAEAHALASGIPEADLLDARLAADMLPLAYQIKSMAVHSMGAIEGIRQGSFSPDSSEPPASFAALRARIDRAIAGLETVSEAELEGFIGKDMAFTIGERMRIPFTAENFLLSFSLPNFFFHATTAYGILRHKGVDVGKRDFMGQLRTAG